MLAFFNTGKRMRFLLIVAVFAIPILIAAAVQVSNMTPSVAAEGQPNRHGGLHYRIEDRQGIRALPVPLASLLPMPSGARAIDVILDTDSAGKVVSANIKAFSPGDFKSIAAFHRASLNPVTRETTTSLWGNRDGYEIKINDEAPQRGGPFDTMTKVDYAVSPIKPAAS